MRLMNCGYIMLHEKLVLVRKFKMGGSSRIRLVPCHVNEPQHRFIDLML